MTASQRAHHGVGPFVTWTSEASPSGDLLLRTSRRQRKGHEPLRSSSTEANPHRALASVHHNWLKTFAPLRIGWWIAICFMIGSTLFAIGSGASLVGLHAASAPWVFFLGSLFFTTAAFLQWLEAINNDLVAARVRGFSWRIFMVRPRNLGYIATTVQLLGTLFFNANTGYALIEDLDWRHQELLIWTPNLFGSICFLVASQAALMEVSHSYWSWRPRDLTWWIAAVNMLGSIFFMISALAAFVVPGGGAIEPLVTDLGTLAGALCFFTGAYLLIPELFEVSSKP